MTKVLLITGVCFALLAGPASAAYRTFTLIDQAPNIRPSLIKRAEAAVSLQSVQLSNYWHTPKAIWGPGGWPVYLVVHTNEPALTPGTTASYHYLLNGIEQLYVATNGAQGGNSWEVNLSHEVMESLVDPAPPAAPEVADPVEGDTYAIDGIWLSDFVTPRFVYGGASGKYDAMGVVHAPASVNPTPGVLGGTLPPGYSTVPGTITKIKK